MADNRGELTEHREPLPLYQLFLGSLQISRCARTFTSSSEACWARGLHVPDDLKRRIDYHQEREALLAQHASELEVKVRERTQDLEAAQEELIKRERLSVLGQLTAVVSHELRNPLGVIGFSAYYLTRNVKEQDEKVRKHLNRIGEQVGHCDLIIDELLDYTRGTQSSLVRGEINPWLATVLDQITTPQGITVKRKLAAGLPPIKFDGEKLRRVIINLVENAFQAVQARSAKEKSGSYRPLVRVSTSMRDSAIYIELEDNGIGMAPEHAAKAFEPLFTTRSHGTGLGLAVVKKIVNEHRGQVSLSSRPNHGTTVTVSLTVER